MKRQEICGGFCIKINNFRRIPTQSTLSSYNPSVWDAYRNVTGELDDATLTTSKAMITERPLLTAKQKINRQ